MRIPPSYSGMHKPQRLLVASLLIVLAVFSCPSTCFAQNASHRAKTYPDLNGTVWTGTDFQGKKYTITFHTSEAQKKLHILQRQDEWVTGGTFSVVTDPPQKLVGGDYGFVGPPEPTPHGDIPTYKIQFYWPGTGICGPHLGQYQMQGRLIEGRISMEYVEPVVVGIDFTSLLGKADKGKQWYGEVIDCLGHDISISTIPSLDAVRARGGLEEELVSGNWGPGPYGLGEVCYSQGPNIVCFVRDNLFIFADRRTLPLRPEVEKEFMKILYKLDFAIRDEDPSVETLRMPKLLTRTR